jgi:hypothetical protein
VTKNAVFQIQDLQVKRSMRSELLFPRSAFVDPTLSAQAPLRVRAGTGFDALTHLVEAFSSQKASAFTDALARDGIPRAVHALYALAEQRAGEAEALDLAVASTLGGICLANAGLGAAHGLIAPLSGLYPNIPHGAGLACMLPATLTINAAATRRAPDAHAKLNELARLISGPSATIIMPLRELVAALAARGIDTLVDGAHGPGMLALDLETLGAAYYTGNLHKWCCAHKGAAFLWVRRDRQALIHPLVISHGWAATRTDRSRFQLEFDWVGTLDASAILSVPSALAFLRGLFEDGFAALYAHNHALALRARDILCAALGTAPAAPDALLGSLAVALFPAVTPKVPTADALYRALLVRGIEVPIVPFAGHASGFVRIAAQVYNSESEFVALAEALRAELGLA